MNLDPDPTNSLPDPTNLDPDPTNPDQDPTNPDQDPTNLDRDPTNLDRDPTNLDRPSCPFCQSTDIELVSPWGGQLITSAVRCRSCNTHFEAVRDAFDAAEPAAASGQ